MVDGPYITWEDFVQSYLDPYQADNDNDTDVDLKERLEVLAQHPMQINLLGRDDLLQLPFITGEQADSLLSYRAKKHGFVSLGELQLIRGMDYYTRVYLSLFVRCEAAYPPTKEQLQRWKENDKITKKLFTGNHTIESRLDWPLYQREDMPLRRHPQLPIGMLAMRYTISFAIAIIISRRCFTDLRSKRCGRTCM